MKRYRSHAYVYLLSWGALVSAGIAGVLGCYLLANGVPWNDWLAALLVAPPLVGVFAYFRRRVGIVTVYDHKIEVRQAGESFTTSWEDVERFGAIPLLVPATYRFVFRSRALPTYFMPFWSLSIVVPFWTFHFSEMGRYIRERLELRDRLAQTEA